MKILLYLLIGFHLFAHSSEQEVHEKNQDRITTWTQNISQTMSNNTVQRALHFVLKIGNLQRSIEFFRDKLGMTVLRHEVFTKGCEAACNGPYDGKWSKTMIGYGAEDSYFVLELTYNYSVGKYSLGNDLQYIKISLGDEIYEKLKNETAKESKGTEEKEANLLKLHSPDGYEFLISKLKSKDSKPDLTEVCLSCKSLINSTKFWEELLKMKRVNSDDKDQREVLLSYADDQASLRLKEIDENIDHKSAFGRIAYSCPSSELKGIQKTVEDAKLGTVLTPYLSLDTPGKATVQVVILGDPDAHEICFVGDEAFRELSQVDPKANELLEKAILEDKSDEWFQKKKLQKTES